MRVLYYGGATMRAHGFTETDASIHSLLKKISKVTGDELVELEDEKPGTDVLFNLGFRKEALAIAKVLKEQIEALKPDVMVSAYGVTPFVWEFAYPETFNLKLSCKVIHIGEYIYQALKDHKLDLKETKLKKIFLHHGCTPARKLGIMEQPRYFYNQIPGLEYGELNVPPVNTEGEDPAKWTTCTGVWQNMTLSNEVARNVADNMIRREIEGTGAEAIATTCACAFKGLHQGIEAGGHQLKALYFTDLIDEAWREE